MTLANDGPDPMTRERLTEEVHQRLGYRRLNTAWAKLEILFGLLAAGLGLFLGFFALAQPSTLWQLAAGGLALFVLGGYLALAGNRSHLYQSSNDRAVLLIEEMRQLHAKGPTP
jgi:hypothetical protein